MRGASELAPSLPWELPGGSPFAPSSGFSGIQGVLSTPLGWQGCVPPSLDGLGSCVPAAGVQPGLGPQPGFDEFKDLGAWPDSAEIDSQVSGGHAAPTLMRDTKKASVRKGSTAASASAAASTRDVLLSSPLPGLPLSSTKSINNSNLNLSDWIKCNSLSDLGLGLSLSKSKSELRAANISELSLGDILDSSNTSISELLHEF